MFKRRWIEDFTIKSNQDKCANVWKILLVLACVASIQSTPKKAWTATNTVFVRGAVYQQFTQGYIDWTEHQWLVKGNSLPLAVGASGSNPVRQAGGALTQAQTDAQQHAAALAKQMPWGLSQDDSDLQSWISARLETLFALDWQKKAKFEQNITTQFFADGHASFEGRYCWDEVMAQILTDVWRLQREKSTPGHAENVAADEVLDQAPTGLVVNTKGLNIKPVLLPHMRDPEGHVLYSVAQIDQDAFAAHGLVRYMYSIDLALRDRALGARPHVVRATAQAPNNPTSIVIQASDLALVKAASEALRRGQVIWIIDALTATEASLDSH